ncbi:MAG: ESPR-type extended signal peptide-containing protein, partial [Veillonella sp.]|uniref:ESPR-type extended signal peptide-containing protein n=1 Tax=Veillonella sp. TaxID=1926307 RepID=UPI00291212A6
MNKIFKVIWSKSKQCYIVVSEIAKNKTGKKKIVVASILAALAMASSVQDVSAVTGSGGTNNFSNAGTGVSFKQGEGLAIGTNATVASGNTNTVAIGVASVANGSSSFAASGGSTASGKDGQIAIGWSSTNGTGAVAIGGTTDTAGVRDTRATGSSAVALGVGSAANGSNAFVASGGSATGNNAIAISGGTADGNGSIAIGWQTNAKNDATAVGSNAQATDKDSVAVGKNSNAAGESATAVGSSATASGRGGVAVGWNAESAVNAVGVGFNAKAKANNTVAIGVEANNDKDNAISNNYSSVSVGVATRARAVGSMAMGVSADASGKYSIALGSGDVHSDYTANVKYPKATGEKAIAIGYNSNSSNTAATAIGAGATASGQDSFAGGSGTAGGNSSIAIGKSSGATNDRALAVGVNAKATGKDTVAVGSGAGGTVGLGFASSIDDNKGVVQTIKNINVATTADGDNAVAVGHYANAMNSGVALGQNTLAATGGVAIGKGVFEDTNNVDAGGTVIGQDSTVTGFYSLAVGRYTFASGSTSMAMGYDASAKGNYAVAMGRKVIADGTSTAIGHHAVATNGGLAIGSQDNDASKDKTTASASGAVAIGKNTQSTLKGAVALGSDSTTATNATKQESVTINGITYNFAGATSDTGMQVSVGAAGKERQIKNVAAGEVSATSTDAINGSQLFAIASQIKPIQYFAVNSSVADNKDNTGATGSDSVAIGPKAKAQAVSSIALGNNATAAGGNSIAIGNTSSATDKQSPISIGYGATANGDFSVAIGGGDNNTNYGATANGVGGTALGGQTKTTGGNFQTAVGFGATTTAPNASAFGYNATTSVEGGVALGFNSSSRTGVNKGYNPNDNRTNKYNDLNGNVLTSTTGAIAVGNGSTVTRQITGVAAGTKDTDAVNVAQLKSVNLAFKGNVGSGDVNLATNDSDKKLTIQGDRTYITTNASGNTLTISANKKDINVTNGTARADAGVADAKNVAEAINNAVSQNKYKWYLTADNDTGGSRATIDKEGTVKFSGDSNITVSRNGNTITTSLNKAITVDSVKANKTITVGTNKITLDGNTGAVTGKAFNGDSFTAGNNVLSNTTLQIGSPTGGNNVSITRDGLTAKAGTKTVKFGTNGIDAGDQQITHVSSGGNVGTNAANITDVKNAVSDVTLKLDTNAKTGNVKLSEDPLKVIGANGIRTDLVGTNNGSLVVGLDSNTVNATTKGIGLTGDTGSTGLKYLKDGDVSFKVAGDGNLVTTKASATGVQVAIDTAKVKDLAVEAVTVSKANTADNPITVTPTASTNSKDYAIGIDTIKLASKTDLTYRVNNDADANAQKVSLAKGLNFVNGDNTVATVAADGKVSYDLNAATKTKIDDSATAVTRNISLGADSGTGSSQSLSNGNVSFAVSGVTGDYISTAMDGSAVKVSTKRATINSDANTGAASVTGADGLATAKNVASAINSAVNGLSQNLNISDGTQNSTIALKNQKLIITGTGAAKTTVNGQTITIDVAEGTLTPNTTDGTVTGATGVAKATEVAAAINNTNTVLGDKIATNITNIAHTIALADDNGTSTTAKSLKDGDVSFAVTGDGNLVSTSATAAGVKVAVDAAKVKDLAVAAVTVSKDTQADNPITVTPTAGANSKDYAIGIDTTKLAAKTDLTYRANSVADANAKKVSLSKGLNFVDGGSTVATVDNDGKVSFDLNTATKNQINTNTADITANKGKIATNTTNIATNTAALARNISLGADAGTASSQSLSAADVAFNVKGATGDFVSTNMNGNTVEISTKRATINSNATTGEASVTGNDGLATAQNVADAINKAADAAKAGAAWNITTNSSTTDKTAVKGGDTVDLVNGDNIEITQDGTDKKKITVATKKDITVDSVTANNKVTVGSGANKITLDGTDGSVTGKAFTGTTFTGTSFTGTSFTAGNTVINTNGLTNGTTAITGTGVTTDNVTVGGISIDKTAGINAGNKVISNVASGGTTLTNAANIGDVQNAVANLSQNLNITDGTNNGTVDLKNQKLNVAGANGVTAKVNNQTITVGLDADTVNATTKGIGLTADTGSTGNKYLKDGDVSFAVTGDGSLVSTSATAAGVKVAVNSASITAGTDGTITGPTTDGVATAKNVADAINAAKKASKTEITANTGEAANATTGNVTLTSTTAADGHTIYDVKLNDKVTLGSGANAVTIDGTTGAITGKTATIGGVTVNGTANTIGGLSNTTWNGTAVSGRAATEDQLKAATGATTLKFTGDVATNTGSVNLKDDTFGIKGDGKYISTDVNGKNVNLTVSEAEVKKSAVAAVTVSTDTTDANNPLTVTPTTSADGTTKDYKVTIDGTKIANKTNLSYKANGGTAKQVSLADGLNFKNGTLTTASIDDNGVVKYDVNTASITAGADGTITGPTTDGVATAQNVADAINAAKKAAKTEITANAGEAANATKGNVTLTSTTAVDGHTIYDVKLNDKVTLGTGANAVTIDGTTGAITGKTATIGGVTVNGTANTIGGLSNTTWNGTATTGRAATEDQLKAVADAASSQTWNITADKAGTTGAQTGTKKNATVGKDETVELVAGDNLTINQNERKFTYSLNKDLANLTSVSVGTGTTETIKLDGATGKITAKNAVIGGVTVDGDNNHVTGLANTTWNGTATTGRAATEDQLKAVAETAKTTTDAVNLKFTGDTNTSPGVVNLKDDTLGIIGDGKYVSTDANGKNLTVKVSEAEVKKSAVVAVTVSTDTTDANNPISVTPTTSADGTTKDYKVTIDGTKIANKTNLSYKANDGTAKQVSLADGLNFKNGTLTTASIDDAGVVKYDVNTATITAGTDGTVTGPTTDGVATAKNVADAINAAKKASKTEITANTGEVANATTRNVTLTSTTAADGHTIYDVKLNDKVTLGTGANAVTIDGTAGKATIGSSVINGVNNTFTTGGAKAVTLDGATGIITGTTANIGGVTVNGTANTIGGLSNTTWNGTATTGRAATEDQLKAVADAAGSQTWEITSDKKAGTSGAQTGTKENAKVGKDDKVSLIAGENLTVDQAGKNFTYSLNADLVKMNSATFLGAGTNTTVITGNSITQTAGTQTNTSTAGGNTVADGTKSTETTAAGQVIKDGAKSNKSTVDSNVID